MQCATQTVAYYESNDLLPMSTEGLHPAYATVLSANSAASARIARARTGEISARKRNRGASLRRKLRRTTPQNLVTRTSSPPLTGAANGAGAVVLTNFMRQLFHRYCRVLCDHGHKDSCDRRHIEILIGATDCYRPKTDLRGPRPPTYPRPRRCGDGSRFQKQS